MAIGDIKTFDIVYNGLTLKVNAIDLGNGQTTFSVLAVSGSADINAIYWGDGDSTAGESKMLGFTGAKSESSLGMNGSGVAWDGGVKLSDAGLGSLGQNKATYLTAGETYDLTGVSVNWNTISTLGVRATSTSTDGGSIKGVDNKSDITTAPHISINDVTVTEGVDPAAKFTISLDHAYAYDITVGYQTADDSALDGSDYTGKSGSVTILAGQTSADVSVSILDDAVTEPTETFKILLNGATADIPGPDISLGSDIVDNLGVGTILDNDVPPPPPTVYAPPTAAADAGSHGYWMNHSFDQSEGFAGAVGNQTFDKFFNLDSTTAHTWVIDPAGSTPATTYNDLTFSQAVGFGNGGVTVSETPDIGVNGSVADLVREATTAVLNFYDADHSASFVQWYTYERNVTDKDGNALNNPTDAASVLADLKAQVQATVNHEAGAYTVDELASLLHQTHEA